MREDRFTNTPEDAAAFERRYGPEPYDDGPDLSDVAEGGGQLEEGWMDEEAEDLAHGIVHPPWCTRPPGHAPWWIRPIPGAFLIEWCEPERVGDTESPNPVEDP